MSINKVAELAGVSNSTVSRVINNHPRVAVETAKAVKDAMKQLNYVPSDRRPGPKPMSRHRTQAVSIAFLVFGTSQSRSTPAFMDLLHGVFSGASSFDVNLQFAHVLDVQELPARITDHKIDGVLLHGLMPAQPVRDYLSKLPTVWLMGNRRRPDWGDQVMPDAYDIGASAAKYMLGRGHRAMAFLNLDKGFWPFQVMAHSYETVSGESEASFVKIELSRSDSQGYWPTHSRESVQALVEKFLAEKKRPTGIMVADDMQAALIQPALQEAGIEIGPGKTELISCNNEKPYLLTLKPRPAVVDIRVEAIGRRGVEQLLWRLEHRNVPERLITAIEPIVLDHDGNPVDRGLT
jgi:LacI family transcriptional regulator